MKSLIVAMTLGHAITLGALLLSASRAGAQVASTEEIAQLVSEHKYPQALQRITAGLALKGQAAKLVNRYELLMFKGECHVQTRNLPLAVESYANAGKEEAATRPERLIAAAHVALLKASKAFAYTPKVAPTAKEGRPSPIDIVDKSNRKRAFAAMLADELAAGDAKLKAAKSAKTLGPITELAAPLAAMEGIELAATGEAAKVTTVRAELTMRAKRVLADTLREMTQRVTQVDKEANTFIETYQDVFDTSALGNQKIRKERVYKKRGLDEPQTAALQAATATCRAIDEGLSALAAGLVVEEKEFEPFAEDAGRLRKEVARVLDTDYQRVYREIPR